eukprot:scaffold913_cov233-Pinguiococcus_pyrenoidosus.AAC.15
MAQLDKPLVSAVRKNHRWRHQNTRPHVPLTSLPRLKLGLPHLWEIAERTRCARLALGKSLWRKASSRRGTRPQLCGKAVLRAPSGYLPARNAACAMQLAGFVPPVPRGAL